MTMFLLEVVQDGRPYIFDSDEWDWKYEDGNCLLVMRRDGRETIRFYGTYMVVVKEVDRDGKEACRFAI